jgi:large subunit ribosomal protein L16
MGKGKGSHSIWICPVRKGQVVCEISGVSDFFAERALLSAGSKLPLKTKIFKSLY